MSRFRTLTGVVVSVADEEDHLLYGANYRRLKPRETAPAADGVEEAARPQRRRLETGAVPIQRASDDVDRYA